MIKYHGTPIGGTKWDAFKFLGGRHALISFESIGQTAEVLDRCESFCLDNGAFTKWKSGKGNIDVTAYKEFVEDIGSHPAFDFALIPDIIMGTAQDNDNLIRTWECNVDSVPVYHLGEPVDRFLQLADNYSKVALGSTDLWSKNGSKAWWENMANFMDAITDNKGRVPCKLHGLRMLDPNLFKYLPLHSGDSSNAAVNGHLPMKKGIYPCIERYQGAERIAQRIEAFQSAAYWDRQLLVEVGKIER